MPKSIEIEFKTLLTEKEYNRLMKQFAGNPTDLQTNHYFDTPRFSLKAHGVSLRVRERDNLEITLKQKKRYETLETTDQITKEQFEDFKNGGEIPSAEITTQLQPIVKNQRLVNFMSLSTLRMYFPYNKGVLFIDKSSYLGVVDYELEYEATSYYQGRQEFIEIIRELDIKYKKSDKKIKRAYNAYKIYG